MREYIRFLQLNKPIKVKALDDLHKQISNKNSLLKYSYILIDHNYYFFICTPSKEDFNLPFFNKNLSIKKQITKNQYNNQDKKPRTIRSLRGFLLLVLGLKADKKKTFTVLSTNLSENFWDTVEKKIRYNKKYILRNFVFHSGSPIIKEDTDDYFSILDSVKKLQCQVNELLEINTKLLKDVRLLQQKECSKN